MNRFVAVCAGMVLFAGTSLRAQEEERILGRVVSAGLFKNGLAVITEQVEIDRIGWYGMEFQCEPIHGTFWLRSTAKVEATSTMREFEVPFLANPNAGIQDLPPGTEVTLHLRQGPDERRVLRGVLAAAEGQGKRDWGRDYSPGSPSWSNSYVSHYSLAGLNARNNSVSQTANYIILRTPEGLSYIERTSIWRFDLHAGPEERAVSHEMRPVLQLTVPELPEETAQIWITYLAKGITWAPSYRVELGQDGELLLAQKAVVRNELRDLSETEIELISGFPNIPFGNVVSPFLPSNTLMNFFAQLNAPTRGRDHVLMSNAIVMQQAASPFSPVTPPGGGPDALSNPTGEGVDLYYQPIGKHTIREGDSLLVPIAETTAPYKRVVEWLLPDLRREDGRVVPEHERRNDPALYDDSPWDAIQFRNPFEFPLTTAVASIFENDRFRGQTVCNWTNPDAQATLRVTKALSIETLSVENEQDGERSIVWVGGDDYRRSRVKGTLTVQNHRGQSVEIIVRRRFSGLLVRADENPAKVLLPEGVFSVNERNELTWTVELQPGEKKELTYEYDVLVNT